ncbi:MAG: TPM domain-containing protein [Xanthomonadales bacterium]|nr:TPM domain-containing protein [Xanthomonadales bacterium]
MSWRTGVLLALLALSASVFYLQRGQDQGESQSTNQSSRPFPAQVATTEQAVPASTVADLNVNDHPEKVININGSLGHFTGLLEDLAGTWSGDLGIELQIIAANLSEAEIEEFASALFQQRRIGSGFPNGGLLILLDGAFGKARIEVSYELEQAFPDAFVGRLAETQLAPYAASKMAGMAVMDTSQYLKDFAFLQAAAGNLPDDGAISSNSEYQQKLAYLSGGAGATVNIEALVEKLGRAQAISEEEAKAYSPGDTPELSVSALMRVWTDMVTNPDLNLYTPASQVLNAKYPYAPFEVAERLRRLQRSGDLRTIRHGEFAVVTSDRPAQGFTPILLRQMDGLWRVDLAETWKNLFFNEKGDYFLKNSNTPYLFGLEQFGNAGSHPIDAVKLNGNSLQSMIQQLESRDDALAHFELAELLFRNSFAALAALDHYEKAVQRAPVDPLFRSTLADRYMYLGFADMAVPHLIRLGAVAQVRLAKAYANAGNYAMTEKIAREILVTNPYSYHGLAWLDYALKMQEKDSEETSAELQSLLADPQRKMNNLRLGFDPAVPGFDNETTVDVGGTTVYGHGAFTVYMTNFSKRAVQVDHVYLSSLGTAKPSGLGDIKAYWTFPQGDRKLAPGETIRFYKTWGFTVKTRDQRMSYLFNICWHGMEDTVKQCESQLLNLSTTASVFLGG